MFLNYNWKFAYGNLEGCNYDQKCKHYENQIVIINDIVFKGKHKKDVTKGWYRYDSKFVLPIYADDGEGKKYNVFHASLIVRHAADDKMYLYDIIDKKETSNPLQS